MVCTTDWQKSISTNVIDECLTEIEIHHSNQHSHSLPQPATRMPCNVAAIRFTICALRKFNDQCPPMERQKCAQPNGKLYQTAIDDESQSDEMTRMDFVASRIPSRDHIIFGFD